MVFRIIDISVIGIDDPFAASVSSGKVNVAFMILLAGWKFPFIIAETIPSDTFTGSYFIQITGIAVPPQLLGFFLRDIIGGKMPILMNIGGDILFGRIFAVFFDLFIGGFIITGRILLRSLCCLRILFF